MTSKILQEFAKKNPRENQIVGDALNFVEQFDIIDKIPRDNYLHPISLAENLAKSDTSPDLISVALLHNVPDYYPEKQKELENLLGKNRTKLLCAFNLAKKYHKGQNLRENRTYLGHAIDTACILGQIKLDCRTIAAGLLHHLVNDAQVSINEIEKNIDKKIAAIISNYAKIDHFTNKTKSFNNNVREILLAMTQDVRVIFIKMASTIDSLSHYETIETEDKYLVAKQAKEILAPIADMIGAWRLRWQLEDKAFKILQPKEYEKIADRFGKEGRRTREKYISKLKKIVLKESEKLSISCSSTGRFKHYYSIYLKMKKKQRTFNEIFDVFALRVIVSSPEDCYRMMGIIHRLFPPVPKRIKDYIAAPKANGYQSIHTTVIGPGNRLTEFQIRTQTMNDKALYGLAAHAFYKDENLDSDWARQMLNTSKIFTQKDIWEDELSKIFQEKIYVYTPKGDIYTLPKGATPVDFAYLIHSELGHFCKFAIVNNQPAELSKKLQNEDVVEIIPDINSEGPDPAWMKFVKTALAKRQIEKFIKSKGLL